MKGVSVLFFLGCLTGWSRGIFLNHRPFPTYSLENMPQTSFSCREKILGGYYADVDTQCQMFHICVKVAGIGVQDFRFLCPNGTAFDQDHQICAEWEDIDCDASTLYYSSDNFDLYRLGSGFESKAIKYGEEEEPFALQRAETGDARINREQQARIVDQKKAPRNYNQKASNNDRDIFKGSSSSNFYNNRNNGKERDEDYDDNVNVNQNQNQDYESRRKVVRNKVRRPVQNNNNNNNNNNNRNQNQYNNNRNQESESRRVQNQNENRYQNNEYNRNVDVESKRVLNQNENRYQNNDYNRNRNTETTVQNTQSTQQPVAQTRRPSIKFTGFVNNFAGSYEPTTARTTSTTLNSDQYTTAINNYKNRNNQRTDYTDSPVYTISTPAPFRQQSPSRITSNNNNNNNQFYSTTTSTPTNKKSTSSISTTFDDRYDIPKIKSTQYEPTKTRPSTQFTQKITQYETTKPVSQYETTKIKQTYKTTVSDKTENYPSNNPKYSSAFEKKQTTPYKQNDYPTTLSPKPFSLNQFPTTFAPRTNAAYSQLAQHTQQSQNTQQAQYTQQGQTQTQQSRGVAYSSSTQRATTFTQYTPTVPKLTSTTPVSRSGRFDETQYDDGSYSSKYDYDGDRTDEFLKTAHSQNIAASRNELSRTTKQQQQQQQQQQQPVQSQAPQRSTYDVPKTYPSTKQAPKPTEAPRSTKQPEKPVSPPKKIKDVSYDYAYYDSNVGSEADYEIDTEIKKSTVKN